MTMHDRDAVAHPEPIPIQSAADVDRVLEEPLAVLYKHSPLCGLSTMAAAEVRSFMAGSPDVPVYIVDVVRHRPASRELERRLSVRHESPQAFVLRDGEVAWHGSHRDVKASALDAAF